MKELHAFNERQKNNEKVEAITYIQGLINQAKSNGNRLDILQLEKTLKLLNSKKYGLVWEEHTEKIEENMKTKIPVFVENVQKKISTNTESDKYNFFIEGDNLHSLHLLEKTHLGKIDVIYIDPPYNTGHEDFKYNDKFLKPDDTFRHSKWLSFMHKRLSIAKNLLTSDGVIFVSIDENEQANLELLMNEIFGYQNKVGEFIWKGRSGKGGTNSQIAFQHEYIKVYAKNASVVNFYQIQKVSEKDKTENLRQWGDNGPFRSDRPTMFFPVLFDPKNNKYSLPTDEELLSLYNHSNSVFDDANLNAIIKKYKGEGYQVILPQREDSNDGFGRWRQGVPGFKSLIGSNLITHTIDKSGQVILKKIIPSGKESTIAIDSILDKVGTSSDGTKEIKKMFGKKVFDTTKPVALIKYLVFLGTFNKPNGTILDFFAGSGTTGEAVIELNKIDNGNRNFIIGTNNEGGIAEEVTYPRMEMVAHGYKTHSKFKKTIYEERLTPSRLKHMASILQEIDQLKLEHKNSYSKMKLELHDQTLALTGEVEKEALVSKNKMNLKYFKTEFVNKNEFPDESLEYELLKFITPLVELEFSIDITNPKVQIVLSESQLDSLIKNNNLKRNSTVFIHPDVFFDTKQNKIIKDLKITIQEIPDYFFGKELWSR